MTMHSPLVDVVIPTFRRNDSLLMALESVANQTYSNWQCWIAEDGQSKETSECVQSFCQDKRFTYFPGEHFGFPAGPRNRAILAGSGKYIALLDDDDYWLSEKLQYQVDFMDKHQECAMVGVNAYIWLGQAINRKNELPLYHEKVPEGEVPFNKLLQDNCFIGSGVCIRRSSLSKAGLFNTDINPPLGEDYEMWLRLAATGSLWFLVKPLLCFRENQDNKYYGKKLTKAESYEWKAQILSYALKGCQGCQPFREPQNEKLYRQVKKKIHRLEAGPSLPGLLKYFSQQIIHQIKFALSNSNNF
jgi:glycosyltransferase involved in cell wall biosynthesis